MFRKYMIISLAACLLFATAGCTSKTASDESADVEEISDSGADSLETADAVENNGDLALEDSSDGAIADLGDGDGLALDEQLPAGDNPKDAVAQTDDMSGLSDLTETPPEAMAATEPTDTASEAPPADDSYAAATPEPAFEPAPEPMAEPTSEPTADTSSETVADSSAEPPASQTFSLKKINSQPYRHGKILVNAIYIARAGDTVEGISQKVMGSPDHVKDICKINAYNCSRGIKVGDKYYYNSPQRPDDDTTVKTFYEDAGISPQVYTAQAGDNIRKLGMDLLGHERSWMELWATNDVESKGELDAGIQLRYWPSTGVATPSMASTEPVAPPPMEEMAPPPPVNEIPQQAANEIPPPPPAEEMVPADLPPPPDQGSGTAMAGSVEPPPPPPPPPPMDQGQTDGAAMDGGQDPNQTMALGVGAILLLAAAALFISIRKKRARRHIDFNTSTQTQIE